MWGTSPEQLKDLLSDGQRQILKERGYCVIALAIYYYWHGGDVHKAEKEIFKGITLRGKYDVVENVFREATVLDLYALDLKFSLASTQLIQKRFQKHYKHISGY
jgi:hypothetical protein